MPERQDEVQPVQLHASDGGSNSPDCNYSLESLIALQKRLENGIPENAEDELVYSPAPRTKTDHKAQRTLMHQLHTVVLNALHDWKQALQLLFGGNEKGKETGGKGTSA